MRRLRYIVLAIAVFMTGAALAYRYVLQAGDEAGATSQALNIQPARPLPPLSLETLDGQPVGKDAFRNRWTVLTFGFTHCPMVCPTNMAYLKQEIQVLGDAAKDFTYLLVTVDPERDTGEVMKSYLAGYHPLISGLRGSQANVDRFLGFFGAYVARSHDAHGAMDITHSPHFFVVNPRGEWVGLYGLPLEKGRLAENLRTLKGQADSLL